VTCEYQKLFEDDHREKYVSCRAMSVLSQYQ